MEDSTETLAGSSSQLTGPHLDLEQQVADRTRELATLNTIAAVVSRSLDLQEILNDALDETLQVMGLDMGGVYLLDAGADMLNMVTSRGFRPGAVHRISRLHLGEAVSGRVAQSGQPIVEDESSNPVLAGMLVGGGIRSLASVPLTSKEKVLGTLFAGTRRYRKFTPQDVQLLASIGHQIGVAIENARLYDLERRRAEQFRLIGEVGRDIVSILDVDELLGEVARRVSGILGYYLVGVGLIEGDDVVMKAGVGSYWEMHGHEPVHLGVGQEGIVGWVAATGEPLLAGDVTREPRYHYLPQIPETRSELAVPLRAKGRVIGVLDVQSRRLNAFDESDVVVLQSLADQAAMALDNARLFEAERRLADQFRLINEVGRRMTAILEIDRLLDQMARMVQEAFDYYLVEFGVVDGDEVAIRIAAGRDRAYHIPQSAPDRLKVGREGIIGWVAGSGEPLLVPDVSKEPRYVQLGDVETRSELAVPIESKGTVIGVLNVESDLLNAFDEGDLVVLQSLANQAAVAVENARLYEQARKLAVVEERQRLARDLHDSVTQALYGMALYAEAAAGQLSLGDVGQVAALLGELQATAQEILAEMRLLIYELRPPVLEEEGLVGALRARLQAVEARVGLKTDLKVVGKGRLPLNVEEGLYRIAQEALNNALKHAHAHSIAVCLRQHEGTVILEITDDGMGFNAATGREQAGLGLSAMEERTEELGGELTVRSGPGKGTRVRVEVVV